MDGEQQFKEYFHAFRGPIYYKPLLAKAREFGLDRQEALAAIADFYAHRHKEEVSLRCDPLGPFVEVQGLTIHTHMPKVDCALSMDLLTYKLPEQYAIDTFLDHAGAGDSIVDVGANIGYHSLRYCRHVGNQGRVFSFEPDPWNFHLLQKNLVLNGCQQAASFCCALGNDKAMAKRLFVNPGNHGDIRSFDPDLKWATIETLLLRLNGFFAPGTAIHGMKIDTQGSEYDVLLGGRKLIESQRRLVVQVEFAPHLLQGGELPPQEFEGLLLSLGFKIYEIDAYDERLVDITGELAARTKDKPEGGQNAELLCVKG